MSPENVKVAATTYRQFAATKRPTGLAPDLVWVLRTFRGWPDEEEYLGPDGFMEFLAKWREPYDEWDFELEDVVDTADDRVLAVGRQRGRLKGAGSWVELRFGIVNTVAGGLIRRMEVFATPAEALEAVGLRE
jgi:ketosteroid isomerase-like protein